MQGFFFLKETHENKVAGEMKETGKILGVTCVTLWSSSEEACVLI